MSCKKVVETLVEVTVKVQVRLIHQSCWNKIHSFTMLFPVFPSLQNRFSHNFCQRPSGLKWVLGAFWFSWPENMTSQMSPNAIQKLFTGQCNDGNENRKTFGLRFHGSLLVSSGYFRIGSRKFEPLFSHPLRCRSATVSSMDENCRIAGNFSSEFIWTFMIGFCFSCCREVLLVSFLLACNSIEEAWKYFGIILFSLSPLCLGLPFGK